MIRASLGQAFHLAVADLGLCTAAWLFVRDIGEALGEAGVRELRDLLGRSYPVLDAVAGTWLAGAPRPTWDPRRVLAACHGAEAVLVVGLEAAPLDTLVPQLDALRIGLLRMSSFGTDWGLVLDNYGRRVTAVELNNFQSFAGPRSVLLTFAYGLRGETTHVLPAWSRVFGADIRTQFRSLVAWDVLGSEMFVYPRWLVPARLADFTEVL